MTQDEIIEMARQASAGNDDRNVFFDFVIEELIAFAKLVAEKEREECKKCCTWKTGNQFVDEAIAVCYRAIDQRGKA